MTSGLWGRFPGKAKFAALILGNIGACPSVLTALVAAGTNQATSLALSRNVNVIATAAASTGVSLPAGRYVGQECYIYNDGANPAQVYGVIGGTDTIDGVAGATGVALTNARRARFRVVAVSVAGVATWKSDLLGAVST